QVARVELEEAQGTLLAFDNVTVVDSPVSEPRVPRETRTRLAEETPFSRPARSVDADVLKTSGETTAPAPLPDLVPRPASTPTTLNFDVLIGESRPIRIRGSFSLIRGESTRQK
ncbi:hypothetical protein ACYOEI_36510, partial [Singulisphaera rosea]